MKLVDGLLYTDQVKNVVKKRLGVSPDSRIHQISVSQLNQAIDDDDEGEEVAVYYAYGDVVDGAAGGLVQNNHVIDAQVVCRDLEELMNDDDVKAVVLRVNSGGGSAYASEQIWHQVMELKKKKPVVVSMGGMAASGYNFISGTLNNFGDRNTLHGSIDALAENKFMEEREKYPNIVGTGLFMEGIFQNPLYFDLASDMLTRSDKPELDSWLKDYARRRYGSDEACLFEAVKDMHETCYSKACTGRETASIICARPAYEQRHTAPNDVFELRYDNEKLLDALENLLKAEHADTDGYRFDVCDLTRQVLSNYAKDLYKRSISAFDSKNISLFEKSVNTFVRLLEDVDRLLMTRPELTLGEHVRQANAYACSDKDRQNFELNELYMLTLWGPARSSQLYDYAWKEWGGMIKTFYLPRWCPFFRSAMAAD